MIIREIQKGDFQNLTALSIQVWLHTYAKEGIQDKISKFVLTQFTPEYFKSIYESNKQDLLVVIVDDHLIGFITIDLDSMCGIDGFDGYEVITLYVQEYFQGKGIGTRLLNSVMDKHGPKLWLHTWIHNDQGIAFYQNFGFKKVGVIPYYIEGEKHDNLVFTMS